MVVRGRLLRRLEPHFGCLKRNPFTYRPENQPIEDTRKLSSTRLLSRQYQSLDNILQDSYLSAQSARVKAVPLLPGNFLVQVWSGGPGVLPNGRV